MSQTKIIHGVSLAHRHVRQPVEENYKEVVYEIQPVGRPRPVEPKINGIRELETITSKDVGEFPVGALDELNAVLKQEPVVQRASRVMNWEDVDAAINK